MNELEPRSRPKKHEDSQAIRQKVELMSITAHQWLQRVRDEGGTMEEIMPDDIPFEQLDERMGPLCAVNELARRTIEWSRPWIGRALLIYEQHAEYYQRQGYPTYKAWMERGVYHIYGIAKATAYEYMKTARALGFMPAGQLLDMSAGSQNILAAALTTEVTPDMAPERIEEVRQEWVEEALKQTTAGLREFAVARGVMSVGDMTPRQVVSFPLADEFAKDLDDLVRNPYICDLVGIATDVNIHYARGRVCEAMIAEFRATWLPRPHDAGRNGVVEVSPA